MTRDEVFVSLRDAHIQSWTRHPQKNPTDRTYERHFRWRMDWWNELERAFPDKIKDGVHVQNNSFGKLPSRL